VLVASCVWELVEQFRRRQEPHALDRSSLPFYIQTIAHDFQSHCPRKVLLVRLFLISVHGLLFTSPRLRLKLMLYVQVVSDVFHKWSQEFGVYLKPVPIYGIDTRMWFPD